MMRPSLRSVGAFGQVGSLHDAGAGRVLLAMLIPLLLLAGLIGWITFSVNQQLTSAADDLSRQVLVGPRNLTCQRVVILLDQSGSMDDFRQVRTDAIDVLASWAPKNLRGNDELALISWADIAATQTSTTPIASLTATTLNQRQFDLGGGTQLLPAVQQLATLPSTVCRTSLVFISDGEIGQIDQSDLDGALSAAGVDSISLVLPNSQAAPEYWMQLLPYTETFNADQSNSNQTARAMGQAIAAATNQQLQINP
ncbi:MAG: VWA domain-containing protein [Cryobacterium sp.]|nr:VWA domain-containing protein [Cryobacterium sp.]